MLMLNIYLVSSKLPANRMMIFITSIIKEVVAAKSVEQWDTTHIIALWKIL